MAIILVTGATGQIGASLAKKLLEQGHAVHAFALPNTAHPFLQGSSTGLGMKMFYGDLLNPEDVRKAMKGCEYVYHVAGLISYYMLDRKKLRAVNVDGTRNVLLAAKELGVKKVVVTVSTAGIGIPKDKDTPLDEDEPFDLRHYKKVGYMHSKYLCILECKRFATHGLDVSMVSPTTVYGQGDVTMHVGKLIMDIQQGRMRSAPPGGNAVVSVDDIVDAHILVMQKGRSGENYIFADEAMTYKEMYNRIAKIVNALKIQKVQPRWIHLPVLLWLMLKERFLLLFHRKPKVAAASFNIKFQFRYFDARKAREELGWEPKVHFDAAIKKAILFYRKQGMM